MNLLGFEFMKYLNKRVILVIVPLLLIGNSWFYYKEQMNENRMTIEHLDGYYSFEQQYRELPIEEAYQSANQFKEELLIYSRLYMISLNPDHEFYQMWLEEIEINTPQFIPKFYESSYVDDFELLQQHNVFLNKITEQLEALQSYQVYVNEIQPRAEKMLSYSIFNKENSFSYRNIIKTSEDYAHLIDTPLQLSLDTGVVTSTSYQISDILIMITIFIFSMYIFSSERESGQLALLRTAKRGRLSLFSAKLAALCILAMGLVLLFYGLNLLIAAKLYGFGDMSRYIQSISDFKYSNLEITVQQFLLFFIIGKMAASILLALLFSFLFIICKHPGKAYVLIAVLLTASYMAYRFIHPASYLNVLKYVNVIAFMDTFHFISEYRNLNVGGYPIGRLYAVMVVMLLLCIALAIGAAIVYIRQDGLSWGTAIFRQWLGIFHKGSKLKIKGSHRIAIHEWHKMLLSSKGYLILGIALFISFNDTHLEERRFTQDETYYNSYLSMLNGELNEDKVSIIEEERARFDGAGQTFQRIETSYRNGEITNQQYNEQIGELEHFLLKNKAFLRVYAQYEYLIALEQSKGIKGYFVNEHSSDYFFHNGNRDEMNALLFMFLLLLSLSSLFTYDYRIGMVHLLRSTRRGRLALFISKYGIAAAVTIMIWLSLYTPPFINVFAGFPAFSWDAPIQSIKHYQYVEAPLTIVQYVIIISVMQLIASAAIVITIVVLSQLIKRWFAAILAGLVVLICPLFIQLFGFETIERYSFHYPYILYVALSKSGESTAVIIYFAVLALFSGVMLYVSWKLHNDGTFGTTRTKGKAPSVEVSA